MKILRNSDIATKLSNSFLFLDTNSFITAISNAEFAKFLFEIKEAGCSMVTIQPVLVEFLRGTDTVDAYNTRSAFINDLVSVYPIERHLNEERDLILLMKKFCGKAEYTDFLLGICLGKFASNAYLLTENHQHFPTSLFRREEVITIDNLDQIRNHAIYGISTDDLVSLMTKIK